MGISEISKEPRSVVSVNEKKHSQADIDRFSKHHWAGGRVLAKIGERNYSHLPKGKAGAETYLCENFCAFANGLFMVGLHFVEKNRGNKYGKGSNVMEILRGLCNKNEQGEFAGELVGNTLFSKALGRLFNDAGLADRIYRHAISHYEKAQREAKKRTLEYL